MRVESLETIGSDEPIFADICLIGSGIAGLATKTPTVSFVVPCYKLAHLLPECVHSILSQSYGDLEVLIMDDCSPDNTAEVAQSFRDPRVKHIRNDPNLGNLRNYNKGIGLARGKYIWLISADDYLRRPYLLQRYVEAFEKNPSVGYTICSGVGVRDGKETGVLEYSVYANEDRVVKGHVFLERLLKSNFVLAPSGLVRRECYERLGRFPLQKEMSWSGDWYLWCLFALHWDVAYFAEPMVCYREHGLSMTNALKRENVELMLAGDVAVRWMIKRDADRAKYPAVSKLCLQAIVDACVRVMIPAEAGRACLSREQLEASFAQYGATAQERTWIAARVYARLADWHYWRGDRSAARQGYQSALREDPRMTGVWAKMLLGYLGKAGDKVRELVLASRQRDARGPGETRSGTTSEAAK